MPNFKFEVDADGIALITWDMPGRSMNVIDMGVMEELSRPRRQGHRRRRRQGRRHYLGQGGFLRRRRSRHAGAHGRDLCRYGAQQGRGSCRAIRLRREPQAVVDLSCAGKGRQAVGLRAQWHRDGRRLRARARLSSAHRGRQSEDAAWLARDQDRLVSRSRRHPTHRAHSGARRCAAIPAQGRPAQARPRQGDEARGQRRAARRSDQERRRTGSRPAAKRPNRGTRRVSSCRAGRSIPRPA